MLLGGGATVSARAPIGLDGRRAVRERTQPQPVRVDARAPAKSGRRRKMAQEGILTAAAAVMTQRPKPGREGSRARGALPLPSRAPASPGSLRSGSVASAVRRTAKAQVPPSPSLTTATPCMHAWCLAHADTTHFWDDIPRGPAWVPP